MKSFAISRVVLFISAVMMLSCACGSKNARKNTAAPQETVKVKQYTYKIVNSYPRSTGSYTQGLYWNEGHLWEGTGQRGESALKKVVLETGEILSEIPLKDEYFGEGIAMLGNRIYQLTWGNEVALVYDAQTLEQVAEHRYRGEGWGLTTDGDMLYLGDGASRIDVVDPSDFARKRIINVRYGKRAQQYLNELEWIDGKIWANVYLTESIVIIDPASGAVEGVVDLSGILPESERRPFMDVLNGIAYDAERGRIFVTGKYWPKLYEIELVEK